jgi:hypothetical protein
MVITKTEWEIIDSAFSVDPTNDMGCALRDLFALGCYLHASGQTKAGIKAVRTALRAVKMNERTDGLSDKLLKELPGNEKEYLNKIRPHTELLELLV